MQTHGCSANLAESEMMARLLEEEGHDITGDEGEIEGVDVSIVNICTVKGDTHALREIRKLREKSGKLIVTGCIPDASVDKIKRFKPAGLVSTHNIRQIPIAVNHSLAGEYSELLQKQKEHKINIGKRRTNPVVNIVPISSGCQSACAFCSVKLIKGNTVSYPAEKIAAEIEAGIHDGCKEVWLTSQDNSAYGMDTDKVTALPQLIKRVAEIPGDFKVRIGMMSPQHLFKVQDSFIDAIKSDKTFQFLHLPIQSGSEAVLKRMFRMCSIMDFKGFIAAVRKKYPMATLATDMIVGFPGETEEDYRKSLELLREIKFDIVNISRYAPREGTVAYKWKPIMGDIAKKRSTEMTRVVDEISLELNQRWLDWEGKILIDEEGKDGSWVGRNYAYKQVVVKTMKPLLGRTVKVKVEQVTSHYLIGEMV